MNIQELIDLAATSSGQTQAQLASELTISPARISEWKSGKRTPDASEIAFFAEKAGLPVFETVAQLEAQLNARLAPTWLRALGKLREAGVAASVMTALVISSMMMPRDAAAANIGGNGR